MELRQRPGRRRERPVGRARLAEPPAEVVVDVPGEAAQRVHDEAGRAQRHRRGGCARAEVPPRPDEQDGEHHHEEHALRDIESREMTSSLHQINAGHGLIWSGGREGQVHFSLSRSPLIVIHLVNVGILEDEIDDGEEKAVGGEEEHQQPVGSAGRLAELKRRIMMSRWMDEAALQ